jgi:hypothetical protein
VQCSDSFFSYYIDLSCLIMASNIILHCCIQHVLFFLPHIHTHRCGKTTQVPQIILEDLIDRDMGSEAYIICTQPRRIAAISVAERVAQERLQRCGELVGYQIRLKSKYSKQNTRILFCTTGILLRKMQDKDFLNKVSHIIIDEVLFYFLLLVLVY